MKTKISKSIMTQMVKLSEEWNNTGYAVLNDNGTVSPTVWNQWKNETPQREIVAFVNGNDGWNLRNENYGWEIKPSELMDELRQQQSLSEDKQLADTIHAKICRLNHTDVCGYLYENWKEPGYAKKEYLTKAQSILSEIDFNSAMKVVNHL